MRLMHSVLAGVCLVAVSFTPRAGRAATPRDARPEFITSTDEVVSLGYVVNGKAPGEPFAKVAAGEVAGQEAVFALGDAGPVSSLAIDVDVEFRHRSAVARVVMVDRDGRERLVYETYPALEDGPRVQARGVCEETCHLERIAPAELRVQAIGARVVVSRLLLGHRSYPEDPAVRRRLQAAYKVERINAKFAAGRIGWRADHTGISDLTYEQKRRMFLEWRKRPFLPNLQGFEFYREGIFDIAGATSASSGIPVADEDMSCGTARNVFDWRARHGRNYMTPVRSQGQCGSCWAFAAVGAAEARINTFYNQLLNVDLAEQDSVCVTGNHQYEGTCVLVPVYATYADGCNGGEPQGTYESLTSIGLPLEMNMPYFASHDPTRCAEARATAAGTPRWTASGIEGGARNEGSVKSMLSRGPVTVCLDSWSHCMVIAGYEQYACGTRWILKNSWGTGYGSLGYVRARLDLSDVSWQACGLSDVTLRAPTQMVPTSGAAPAVVCEDRDGDRYCNWGTGPDASSCAAVMRCYPEEDYDDTKIAMYYPWATFGNGLDVPRYHFGDFNGDGKKDVLFVGSYGDVHVTLSNGEEFQPAQPGNTYWGTFGNGMDLARYRFADFNGDGKTDMFFIGSYSDMHVMLSTGSGFVAAQPGNTYWGTFGNGMDLARYQFADFDGDGKTDVFFVGSYSDMHVVLSTGTSFAPLPSGDTYWGTFGNGMDLGRYRYADFDGDGKTDVLFIGSYTDIHVTLSTGTSFAPETYWATFGNGMDLARYFFGDLDGNRMTDVLFVGGDTNLSFALSSGSAFGIGYGWGVFGNGSDLGRYRLGDFTGDGTTDVLFIGGEPQSRLWVAPAEKI